MVITAPVTPDTDGMVGREFLAAMPRGAVLIDAGRGRIVYTDALVAKLQAGRLRAALDVVDPEPLPDDHPLWRCPEVIISPHMARTVPATNRLCYQVAAEQLTDVSLGRAPANAVET